MPKPAAEKLYARDTNNCQNEVARNAGKCAPMNRKGSIAICTRPNPYIQFLRENFYDTSKFEVKKKRYKELTDGDRAVLRTSACGLYKKRAGDLSGYRAERKFDIAEKAKLIREARRAQGLPAREPKEPRETPSSRSPKKQKAARTKSQSQRFKSKEYVDDSDLSDEEYSKSVKLPPPQSAASSSSSKSSLPPGAIAKGKGKAAVAAADDDDDDDDEWDEFEFPKKLRPSSQKEVNQMIKAFDNLKDKERLATGFFSTFKKDNTVLAGYKIAFESAVKTAIGKEKGIPSPAQVDHRGKKVLISTKWLENADSDDIFEIVAHMCAHVALKEERCNLGGHHTPAFYAKCNMLNKNECKRKFKRLDKPQ